MIAFFRESLYTKRASDKDALNFGINFAVLGGEVAVPCTRNPL